MGVPRALPALGSDLGHREAALTLPHARLPEPFVLGPPAETAPVAIPPLLGPTAEQMRRRGPDPHAVKRLPRPGL